MDTPQQASDTRDALTSNLKAVIKDAEELLKSTGQNMGEGYQSARAKFESSLQSAKQGLNNMEDSLIARTRDTVVATDRYVQQHPWQSVGVGAIAGLVIGFMLSRK